ncbi:MAG TPA: hypothetical protein VFB36_09960 [Nevskiaceae bacterium]|nr:hypothetical protein [Nevskiaceae bacterium]
MLFRWLDTSEIAAFSSQLVDDYCRSRSGAAARGDKTPRLESRLQRLADRAVDFNRSLGLNVFKKAKLIAMIRDGLKARGIGDEEVDVFVQALIYGPLKVGKP